MKNPAAVAMAKLSHAKPRGKEFYKMLSKAGVKARKQAVDKSK
jgi:hypothetical protein